MPLARVLCLDLGLRRIGVAVSDPLGITAQPVETIHFKNAKGLRERIAQLCEQYDPRAIVVGLPLTLSGEVGAAVRRVRRLVEVIAPVVGDREIIEWDERLTTTAAERVLLEGNTSRRRRKEVVDQLAASLILQSYLGAKGR